MKILIDNKNYSFVFLMIYALFCIYINYLRYENLGNVLIITTSLLFGWAILYLYKFIILVIDSSIENRIKIINLLLDKKKFLILLTDLYGNNFDKGSVVYSFLMYLVIVFVGFYVSFSGSNYMASGMVMGLILNYLYQQFVYFADNQNLEGWFWQLNFKLPNYFYIIWIIINLGLFILFSYLNFN